MTRRKPQSSPFSLFSFQDIITATTGILVLLALVLALSVVMQQSTAAPAANDYVADLEKEIADLSAAIKQLEATATADNSRNKLLASLTPEELENKLKTLQASLDTTTSNNAVTKKTISMLEKKLKDENILETLDRLEKQKQAVDARTAETQTKLNELQSSSRVVYNFRATATSPYLVEIDGAELKTAKTGVKAPARIDTTVRGLVEFAESQPASQRYFLLLVKPSGIKKYSLLKPYLEKMNADIGVELIGEDLKVVDPKTGGVFQ